MNTEISVLKAARKGAGLSQVELAARSGVSLATIQNIEANRCNPEWNTVLALLDALNLEMAFHKKSPDWNALATLGCPVMPDQAAGPTVMPSRLELERRLQVLASSTEDFDGRAKRAVASWLAALNDHYPSVWMRAPETLRGWFSRNSKQISPKLRRLALEKLGRYL